MSGANNKLAEDLIYRLGNLLDLPDRSGDGDARFRTLRSAVEEMKERCRR